MNTSNFHCYKTFNFPSRLDQESTLNRLQPCLSTGQYVKRRQLCDGRFDCTDLSDECLCNERRAENNATFDICQKLFEQPNKSCSVGFIQCDKDVNITVSNPESTCLHQSSICNGIRDCLDGIDEAYCKETSSNATTSNSYRDGKIDSNNADNEKNCSRYFYCDGDMTLIDWRKRFDGIQDCQDYSDEWHPNFVYCENRDGAPLPIITRCPETKDGDRHFASPTDFVSSLAFSIAEWPIGIISVLGNTAVAIETIRCILETTDYLGTRRHNNQQDGICSSTATLRNIAGGTCIQTKISQHVLVLFLCTSDLLLGLQILSMAISEIVFSGIYWQRDVIWQSSTACSILGFFAVFTSQSSAFIIVVISFVRLHAVRNPFRALKIRYVVGAGFFTWLIAGVLAGIPFTTSSTTMENYFIHAVAVPNNPQVDATVLERNTLEKYVDKILILNSSIRLHIADKKWMELEAIVRKINPDFANWSYLGYYSQVSVCIPPIISIYSDPGWLYTLVMVSLDFVAYSLVMVAYFFVYKTTKRKGAACFPSVNCLKCHNDSNDTTDPSSTPSSTPNVRQRTKSFSREDEDHEMQKRLIWLVATDAICWAPCCILTFISAFFPNSGVKTSTSMLLSMFLIQLNSMVNPIIYSRKIRKGLKRIIGKCFRVFQKRYFKLCRRNASGTTEPCTSTERQPRIRTMSDKATSTSSLENADVTYYCYDSERTANTRL